MRRSRILCRRAGDRSQRQQGRGAGALGGGVDLVLVDEAPDPVQRRRGSSSAASGDDREEEGQGEARAVRIQAMEATMEQGTTLHRATKSSAAAETR